MATPKTILIYTRGEQRIGDGVLKLPFIGAVRRTFPEARITWLAGRKDSIYAGVLKGIMDGVLDEVLVRAGIGARAVEILTHWRPLKGRRFDLIIDTQRNPLRAIVLRRIRHDVFISRSFLLSDRRPPRPWRPPTALVDELVELVSLAAGRPVAPAPISLVSRELRDAAEALLPQGPTYVGLAPGARRRSRCWPLDNFVAVARAQAEQDRIAVFLLGPQEQDWLQTLRRAVPQARFPDTTMKGIRMVVALAERMAAAVANDSGAGHLLAAGGARLVSLVHRPHKARKFRPATPHLIQIQAQQFGGDDMASIPVEAVLSALDEHIEGVSAD